MSYFPFWLLEYIAKYYSKFPSDIKDDVYKAIGNKLNNFSKTSEGRRIINEHLAERAQQQELVEQQNRQQQLIEVNQQQVAAIEMQEQAALPPTATQLDETYQQRQIPHSIVTLQSDAAHEQKRAE